VTDDSPWPAEAEGEGGPWLAEAEGEGGWPEMLIAVHITAERAAMTDMRGGFMGRIVYTHDPWVY
jgi:hypothetical protein